MGSSENGSHPPAIEVRGLTKSFDEVQAVRGVDFEVASGEVFGFLGPNGAGKTTTINMLCTLTRPSAGSATVAGFDVANERDHVRRHIGLVFQDPTLDGYLSAKENLRLHAELYGVERALVPARMRQVLEMVGLWERKDSPVAMFSGGMRRRLEIARGLMHSPRVLFLDEPTIGLDPQTRSSIWRYIRELKEREEITIFMTTHYMDEAEFCDRIAIMDQGQIVALDTPEALKAEVGADVIDVAVDDRECGAARVAILDMQSSGELPDGEVRGTATGYTLFVPDGPGHIATLVRGLDRAGIATGPISVSRPTLDDVFLAATGGRLEASHEQEPGLDGERARTGAGAAR